ncbi:MAG: hypothetical protein AAF213_11585 [Pseudomonadota bacterium]
MDTQVFSKPCAYEPAATRLPVHLYAHVAKKHHMPLTPKMSLENQARRLIVPREISYRLQAKP